MFNWLNRKDTLTPKGETMKTSKQEKIIKYLLTYDDTYGILLV